MKKKKKKARLKMRVMYPWAAITNRTEKKNVTKEPKTWLGECW